MPESAQLYQSHSQRQVQANAQQQHQGDGVSPEQAGQLSGPVGQLLKEIHFRVAPGGW
jgi:hypothetical protein